MDSDQLNSKIEQIITEKDVVCLELGTVDLLAQLYAIEELIRRNQQADSALNNKINSLYSRASEFNAKTSHYWIQDEEWIDESYRSIFQNAAHSMSAVGVLAPFVESMYVRIFQLIRDIQNGNSLPKDAVDSRATAIENEYWDPYLVFDPKRRSDIVDGICQLSSTVGIDKYFPVDYELTLKALFLYRNRLFHHGFEWPEEVVTKFKNYIHRCSWPQEWFDEQLKNDEPWIYTMSDTFIRHCLRFIDSVLEGTGRYIKSKRRNTREN